MKGSFQNNLVALVRCREEEEEVVFWYLDLMLLSYLAIGATKSRNISS